MAEKSMSLDDLVRKLMGDESFRECSVFDRREVFSIQAASTRGLMDQSSLPGSLTDSAGSHRPKGALVRVEHGRRWLLAALLVGAGILVLAAVPTLLPLPSAETDERIYLGPTNSFGSDLAAGRVSAVTVIPSEHAADVSAIIDGEPLVYRVIYLSEQDLFARLEGHDVRVEFAPWRARPR